MKSGPGGPVVNLQKTTPPTDGNIAPKANP